MLDLIEELKLAEQQLLQDEWDKFLLFSWRERKNANMSTLIFMFAQRSRVSTRTVWGLKRVPLEDYQANSTVTRFVAGYLPQLSNLLWDSALPEGVLLARMKKMAVSRNAVDKNKRARERYEVKKSVKAAAGADLAWRLRADQRFSTSRSNWVVCK